MAIQKPFCVMPLPLTDIFFGNARLNRPAEHLAMPQHVGMRWQSDGTSNLWVRGQFDGAAAAVNFMSLMGTNAGADTTIRLRLGTSQAEVDGSSADYDSGTLDIIDPARTEASGRYHSHLEIPSVQTASWWRIDIGGHTGDFSASALIMGEKRTPSNFYNRDREFGFEDLGSLEISRGGVVAEIPGVVLRTLLFRLEWATEEEWWTLWSPLAETNGKRQLLFWCFDPEATVRRQSKTYLGYMARDLFARGGIAPTANQIDFQFRGLM